MKISLSSYHDYDTPISNLKMVADTDG